MALTVPFYQQGVSIGNSVKRLMTLPCSNPFMIYAEVALSTLLNAIATVAEPDAKEVYHQVLGKSLICSIKSEINQAQQMDNADPGPGKKFLFTTSALADEVVWWNFLLGVFADGLISFSSQIQKVNQCQHKGSPEYGNGTGYSGALDDAGGWYVMDYAMNDGYAFGPVSPCSLLIQPNQPWIVADSVSFEDGAGIPVGTNARLINKATGLIIDAGSTEGPANDPNRRTHVFGQGRLTGTEAQFIQAEHQYIGPPRPFREVFPVQPGMSCTLYSPI